MCFSSEIKQILRDNMRIVCKRKDEYQNKDVFNTCDNWFDTDFKVYPIISTLRVVPEDAYVVIYVKWN
mgnify:CR=1 FL=1